MREQSTARCWTRSLSFLTHKEEKENTYECVFLKVWLYNLHLLHTEDRVKIRLAVILNINCNITKDVYFHNYNHNPSQITIRRELFDTKQTLQVL